MRSLTDLPGFLALELHDDADRRIGAQRTHVHHGRVADEVENAFDHCHLAALLRLNSSPADGVSAIAPPATVGKMDKVSPSVTFVSSLSRYLTSSSLR